jgi:NADH-quinone oxidoreductase subunit N
MPSLSVIEQLQADLGRDCLAFLPELILCGGIVLLLLLRLFRAFDRLHLGWVVLVLSVFALGTAFCQWQGQFKLFGRVLFVMRSPDTFQFQRLEMFTGLLVYDNFTVYLRLFLLGFATLIIWLTLLTGIPDREDSADFYCLLFGATLGMSIMASANHLLMVFVGVEMASLPSYALAGFLKGRRQSSEASLKYVVYGGGASGIMLYGISLLAGKFGTASLPALAAEYVRAIQPVREGVFGVDPVLILGTLFLLIGIAFKLAAVPFHFWCPDVFEGACAEVAGFLSVASKGAALALLGRVVFVLGGLDRAVQVAGEVNWMTVVEYLLPALAVFAAVTATFGNLAAYLQTNLKRLLAYSTIAHAGYMMMGLAPLTRQGAAAVLLYLVAYLFMNLGAFAVVAFLRNQTGSEDLDDFRGLVRKSPFLVVTLSVFLLSLLGIPPLAGFFAKFWIFSALYNGGVGYSEHYPGLAYTLYALLVIGGINTVISAVYYLKVMKVMILDTTLDEVEGRPAQPVRPPAGAAVYAALLALVLLVVPIGWNRLEEASTRGVARFGPAPGAPPGGVALGATEVRP